MLKKFLKLNQSYEDVPSLVPKWPICPEQNFFVTNHYYYLHLPTGPFHCAKFKKFLQQIQSYEDKPFLGPKWSVCPKQIFFWKTINIFFIYLLDPFIAQNLKKILPGDAEL